MDMEASITAAAAMRPSMDTLLTATTIATADRTAKCMAGTPVSIRADIPASIRADIPASIRADIPPDTPLADIQLADTRLADIPLAESTTNNL
jgi:hypothetical protein